MAETHVVEQGETLIRLGEVYGLKPETIWQDGGNAALRKRRTDMNELLPGDEVYIPGIRKRTEKGATDLRHRFERLGVPAKIRVQVLYQGAPVANAPYTLALEDRVARGTTTSDGIVEQVTPALARGGLLIVSSDGERPLLQIRLRFGHLDPINSPEGVAKRLQNLGFWRASPSSEDPLREAVQELQSAFGLERSGEVDQATRDLLEQLHDSAASWRSMHEPVRGSEPG